MSDEEEDPVTASEPEEEDDGVEEPAVDGGGGGDEPAVGPAVSFESLMEAPTLAWEKIQPSGSSSSRTKWALWPHHGDCRREAVRLWRMWTRR